MSWGFQSSGPVFSPPEPLKVAHGQRRGCAVRPEHSHARALRPAPPLLSPAGRVCQGEGWMGECGGLSPGGVWGQFGCVPGSSFTDGWRVVQILPLPAHPHAPCGQQLQPWGLGPLLAATAVPLRLGLLVGKWSGLAGGQPVPEALLKRVHVCLGCERVLLVVREGDAGVRWNWPAFWNTSCGLWGR